MKGILKYQNKILLPTCVAFISILSFHACQEPEPFPNTPQIQFNNIQYIELLENGNPDSLILYFDFQDGDGNLGIEGDENYPPFHDFDFVVDNNSKLITYGQTTVETPFFLYTPEYGRIGKFSDTDNRPSFDCGNYDTLYINDAQDTYIPPGFGIEDVDLSEFHKDTVYIQRNPYENNIIVKFFRKRGPSEYEEIDWKYLTSEFGCGISFDGRFFILDSESLSNSSSLEGTIKYAMVSTGFRTVLRKDTFNIKFQVIDRSQNESEFAETGDITLDQLIR